MKKVHCLGKQNPYELHNSVYLGEYAMFLHSGCKNIERLVLPKQ